MTLDEKDALLQKVIDAVGEHCNGFVFVADVDAEEPGDTSTISYWSGGINLAAGLIERMHVRIQHRMEQLEIAHNDEKEE
jgi:hypothetical protein